MHAADRRSDISETPFVIADAMPPIPFLSLARHLFFSLLPVVTFFPGAGRICPCRGKSFSKREALPHGQVPSFEGAVCAADWGSLQLQILAGGGEGRDHLCQLLHHTLIVVLCRSGKLLQLPVELGQIDAARRSHKNFICAGCGASYPAPRPSSALRKVFSAGAQTHVFLSPYSRPARSRKSG